MRALPSLRLATRHAASGTALSSHSASRGLPLPPNARRPHSRGVSTEAALKQFVEQARSMLEKKNKKAEAKKEDERPPTEAMIRLADMADEGIADFDEALDVVRHDPDPRSWEVSKDA